MLSQDSQPVLQGAVHVSGVSCGVLSVLSITLPNPPLHIVQVEPVHLYPALQFKQELDVDPQTLQPLMQSVKQVSARAPEPALSTESAAFPLRVGHKLQVLPEAIQRYPALQLRHFVLTSVQASHPELAWQETEQVSAVPTSFLSLVSIPLPSPPEHKAQPVGVHL